MSPPSQAPASKTGAARKPGKSGKPSFRERMRFVWPYLKRHRKPILWGWLFVVVSTALDQVSPWMVKILLDSLGQHEGLEHVLKPIGGMLAATVVSGVMLYYQRLWVIQASRAIEYEMRRDLFDSFLRQPKTFFDNHAVGDLMSRATNDLDRVRDLVGPAVLHLARMGCILIYTVVCVSLIHWKVALVGLLPALLIPFIANKFLAKMYALFGAIQKSLSTLNAFVQDTVTGVQVVKGFGREKAIENRFVAASADLRKVSLKVAWFNSSIWPAMGALGSIGLILTCWVGGRMVIQGEMTLGDLSAAVMYMLRLQFPLIGLGWVASMIQRANASLDRLSTLWVDTAGSEDAGAEVQRRAARAADFTSLKTTDLGFSYDGKNQVLQGLNLQLVPSKSLGIVGPTGSGKTTLLHILCGLYRPTAGKLALDGRDRLDYDGDDWRDRFAYAPQDGFLFSKSIRDNIAFGDRDGSRLKPEDAAAWAGLAQDIEQFPQGYDSLLGERGINLSGGQRQRVGLARAFLSDAPILCLDDTLSALDAETESLVIDNLRRHLSGIALVVVSHRYSAVRECDEIVYLENGSVKERGTHDELVARGGAYAAVWKRQQLADALASA
jgi:ATP-binding cassette, subfamily B, multidrug efflux pump